MDLSIIIPARNEEFLVRTVEDILSNIEGNTEIIVVLDGKWSDPGIPDHERVTIIYHSESIGQRAAMNEAAKLATGKYIMKVDAHCAFDKGFDVKMIKEMKDDWTMVPVMRNLHVFDWVCKKCGNRRYQGPTPTGCPKCDNVKEFEKDVVWIAKKSPNSVSYCFNPEPKFKYFREFSKRPEGRGDITPTMSLQGSCFMCTLKKYWELSLCDEEFGSWGSQGIEVAVKTWLSGGKVMCNKKTWYAHLFRTQGGDFGFPYPLSGKDVGIAKSRAKDLFFNRKFKGKYPLSWLIKKFWPVQGWKQKDLDDLIKTEAGEVVEKVKKPKKGVVYYTDNRPDKGLLENCQRQILKGIKEKHVVSVSLKPIKFGTNIVMNRQRGYLTMFKQILAGLEASKAEVIFFCEHDVLYHPSHFDFIPPKKDVFYYNVNVWKVRAEDGHSLKVDDCKQTSGLCAYRLLLVEHYRNRIATILRTQADLIENGEKVKKDGYSHNTGFEPGTHDSKAESWSSKVPNLDIRHDKNLTPNRWSKVEFRNQKNTKGWTVSDKVEGWGEINKLGLK